MEVEQGNRAVCGKQITLFFYFGDVSLHKMNVGVIPRAKLI